MLRLPSSAANGFKRATSVQDVHAPPHVVWSVITAFSLYPKMVDGITRCQVYCRRCTNPLMRIEEVGARYRAGAGPYTVDYFMMHRLHAAKHCMTFQFDYSRRSDLDDFAGYWYIEGLADGWSRVWYAADTRAPSWVPAPARNALMRYTARCGTGWVERECHKVMMRPAARAQILVRARRFVESRLPSNGVS
jgi:hypothetical protein